MNLFEKTTADNQTIFFEKSANYFNDPNAPERIRTFFKNIKLLTILSDPIQRAYSWYQVRLIYPTFFFIKWVYDDDTFIFL
jgi:hypothetical protein